MFSKTFSIAAVALAASAVVDAQTFTSCNPLKKTCPADPAFGKAVTCDFTKGACSSFKEADGTKLSYKDNGAVFTINTESNAPTISTGKYIFFGKVDVTVQAAPGNGIVTSSVLQSDDLDEIDWEWIGSDNSQVQTNYFSKGDTSTYDRGKYHPISNPVGSFHTYTIEWTSKQVNWLIDGQSVRILTADSVGGKFPQTPMEVKLGTWCAGGKNSPQGTREWAGGYTDFTKAPFNAYYKSIVITDYAGKDSPSNGGVKEYVYGDQSGNWQSIKVVGGDGNSDSSSSSAASSQASATQTNTSSDKATTTKGSGSSKTSDAKTTMTTATTGASNSTGSGTVTGAPSTTAGSSPTTVPTTSVPGAAPRSAAAIASALMAGAGVALVQLFL